MYPDKELIKKVRELPEAERRGSMQLIEDYVLACELSRGPDPNRSEHWTIKAMHMQQDLKRRAAPKPVEFSDRGVA
jgi:hypothetical protein